jgi:hypothetical protein
MHSTADSKLIRLSRFQWATNSPICSGIVATLDEREVRNVISVHTCKSLVCRSSILEHRYVCAQMRNRKVLSLQLTLLLEGM